MRLRIVFFRNLILFVSLALWRGTPFHLWPRAWREVEAEHRAQVHKAVWELKKQGRIRQDREGRLWSNKEKL
jgi:hypothetical protein